MSWLQYLRLVDLRDGPYLQRNEGDSNDVPQSRHAVCPVLRQAVHLPRSAHEAGVAHEHAQVVDAFPLPPRFFYAVAVFHKMPGPRLAIGLLVEDESDAD